MKFVVTYEDSEGFKGWKTDVRVTEIKKQPNILKRLYWEVLSWWYGRGLDNLELVQE